MSSEPSHPSRHRDLPRDLKALRYLDAIETGDLEAVAALWDEASYDPRLERMLAQLDGALIAEEIVADRSSLAEPSSPRIRRRAVTVGLVGALAAACLLAVLALRRHDGKNPLPQSPSGLSANQLRPRSKADSARTTSWLETRRLLNGEEITSFTWPLPGTPPIGVSRSIPPELLD